MLAVAGTACTETRAGVAGGADGADVATTVGDAPPAGAAFATDTVDGCAVALTVAVGGAFVGAGVGVQVGSGVGLAVTVAVAGASPSRRPLIGGTVAVGGGAVGDGEAVTVIVPVGCGVGVRQGGVFVAAEATMPENPIITMSMTIAVPLAAITNARLLFLCPCILAPRSFIMAAAQPLYTMPKYLRIVNFWMATDRSMPRQRYEQRAACFESRSSF
jgi:hypothetical protein